MSDNPQRNESRDYYIQVTESIKSVFDLTSRIDERVKLIMKKQDEFDKKLDDRMADANDIRTRLRLIEAQVNDNDDQSLEQMKAEFHKMEVRMQAIELTQGGAENRWKTFVNFAIQIAWVLLAAWLLLKLGLQAPAVP